MQRRIRVCKHLLLINRWEIWVRFIVPAHVGFGIWDLYSRFAHHWSIYASLVTPDYYGNFPTSWTIPSVFITLAACADDFLQLDAADGRYRLRNLAAFSAKAAVMRPSRQSRNSIRYCEYTNELYYKSLFAEKRYSNTKTQQYKYKQNESNDIVRKWHFVLKHNRNKLYNHLYSPSL